MRIQHGNEHGNEHEFAHFSNSTPQIQIVHFALSGREPYHIYVSSSLSQHVIFTMSHGPGNPAPRNTNATR